MKDHRDILRECDRFLCDIVATSPKDDFERNKLILNIRGYLATEEANRKIKGYSVGTLTLDVNVQLTPEVVDQIKAEVRESLRRGLGAL